MGLDHRKDFVTSIPEPFDQASIGGIAVFAGIVVTTLGEVVTGPFEISAFVAELLIGCFGNERSKV